MQKSICADVNRGDVAIVGYRKWRGVLLPQNSAGTTCFEPKLEENGAAANPSLGNVNAPGGSRKYLIAIAGEQKTLANHAFGKVNATNESSVIGPDAVERIALAPPPGDKARRRREALARCGQQ